MTFFSVVVIELVILIEAQKNPSKKRDNDKDGKGEHFWNEGDNADQTE